MPLSPPKTHVPTPWTAERQDEESGAIYWAIHSVHGYEFITNVHEDKGTAEFIVKSVNAFEPMREALRKANAFISNGVELGYIRMPDPRIGDPASKTPAIIRAALKLAGDAT